MPLGARRDITLHGGDDLDITFRVVDEDGSAVDITSATFAWVLAPRDQAISSPIPSPNGAALVSYSVGSGITVTDAAAGEGTISLAGSDTDPLDAPAEYYHELQITLGGFKTTLLFGALKLERDLAP